MFAAAKSHYNVTEFLAQNGADIKATDNKGESALDKAGKKGHAYVFQLLEPEILSKELTELEQLQLMKKNGARIKTDSRD